jgi:uncharacterized protein YhbP (UPF0306 family)
MTLQARVQRHLQMHHVATLATSGAQSVWAAAVFYVHDGWNLYFLSAPGSRHCLNLSHSAQVAVTIQGDHADWPGIQGVQIEGVVEELSGDAEARARLMYGQKFPLIGKLAQAPAVIVEALTKIRWYQVAPQRLLFIDNSLGFGHRDELDLSDPIVRV